MHQVTAVHERRRVAVRVAAVVGLLTTLIVLAEFRYPIPVPDPGTWTAGRVLSAQYDPPRQSVETMLVQGDGQIFATHAQDPLIRRPDAIRGGPREQAYRLQRPLYGWLGWMASGGRAPAVPWALLILSAASVTVLAGVIAWSTFTFGGDPRYGLLVLLAPGAYADLAMIGPEALGTALLVVGLSLWARADRSRWAAVTCFATAGLARETMLLVPLALGLIEIYRRRPWREVLPLFLSAAPYVAWVGVLRLRLGVWPVGALSGRISVLPFAGLIEQAPRWRLNDWFGAALALGLGVVAVARRSNTMLRWLVAGHLALAALLGPLVWGQYSDFGRVLLPMWAVSLVALAASADHGRPAPEPSPGGAAAPDAHAPPPRTPSLGTQGGPAAIPSALIHPRSSR